MKKLILIITLAIAAALFSSCGDFNVTCSIDEFNNAEMQIDIKINKDNLSEYDIYEIDSDLYDLSKYWENSLGYKVKYNNNPDYLYDITISKKIKCDSKGEAVTELLGMMGSDLSPFSSVEGGYSTSYLKDYLSVRAEIDLTEIIPEGYMSRISANERNYIQDKLSTFSGTVNFDFFGDTVDYKGSLNGSVITAELSLDDKTEIFGKIEVPNQKNAQKYARLNEEVEKLERNKKQYTIFIILAGLLLLGIIVLTVILGLLRKKSGKAQLKNTCEDISNFKNEQASGENTSETQSGQTQPQPKEEDNQ